MGTPITLQFTTTGNAQVQEDVDADISLLNKLRQTVDLLNAAEVNRFRNTLALSQQYAESNAASALSLAQLESMHRKFEQAVVQTNTQAGQFDTVSSKWRTGANAMSVLSLTMTGATRSMTGLTVAAGTLADAIASVSGNARIAASAAVFGALATAATIVFAIFERMALKTEQMTKEIHQLTNEIEALTQRLSGGDFEAGLTEIYRRAETEIDAQTLKFESFGAKAEKARQEAMKIWTFHISDELKKQLDESSTLLKKFNTAMSFDVTKLSQDTVEDAISLGTIKTDINTRANLQVKEQIRLEEQRFRVQELNSDIALRGLEKQIDATLKYIGISSDVAGVVRSENVEYERRFNLIEEKGGVEGEALVHSNLSREHKLALLERILEKEYQEKLLLEGQKTVETTDAELAAARLSLNAKTKLNATLLEIEAKKNLAITQNVANREAYEKLAAAETAAAWHAAFLSQLQDMRILEGVFVTHHHNLARSVHEGVKNIKAVELGYMAIKNTISGLESSAWAVRFAAEGNWAAAAGEALAATQFFAIAAKAGSEAGGGSGGGGGGGGGAGNQRDNTRIGSTLNGVVNPLPIIEIVIVKQDETGKETARTRQRFQRLDDRNQPIRVAL